MVDELGIEQQHICLLHCGELVVNRRQSHDRLSRVHGNNGDVGCLLIIRIQPACSSVIKTVLAEATLSHCRCPIKLLLVESFVA